jgi:hypothetical protein
MNFDIQQPNIACSYCGDLLYDWNGVLHHWKRHVLSKRQMDEHQRIFGERNAEPAP